MNKKNVLVIDDEPSVCASIELVLEDLYNILTANSANEGIQLVADSSNIDLVLLDMRLPEMDGLTVLERIRSLRPGLKVAIVTAGRADEMHQRALELKVDDYIVKPFEVQDLQSRVKKLIG